MASSVTRHAGITQGPGDWRFLVCGIDTLDLGVYVRWGKDWPELNQQLEEKRTEAQCDGTALWRDVVAGTCLVWPSGKPPMYRYHVQLPDAHVYLQARQCWKDSPNVYISLSARILWRLGPRDAATVLTQVIRELGGSIYRIQVSRADLAADFFIEGGLPLPFVQEALVSRSELRTAHFENKRAETMYVGSRSGAIQARLYDKAVEVMRHGEKLWFADVWKVESIEDIWRIEFQLRRKALKQYRIETVDDLLDKAGGVWSDLTQNWMSLRLRDDSNTTRRTVHPLWQAVSDIGDCFGPLFEVKRDLVPQTCVDAAWYVSHIGGCLAGFAAREGLFDLAAAFLALRPAVVEYWRARNWNEAIEKQRIRLGLELPEKGGSDGSA